MLEVRANGVALHYDVQGSGPTLVPIPLLGADCSISENPELLNASTLDFLRRHP